MGFCTIPVASSQVAGSKRAGEVSSLPFLLGAARHLEPEKYLDPLSVDKAYPVVDDEGSRHGPPVKLWSGVGQVLGGKVWYTGADRRLIAISRKGIRLNVKSGNAWQMARSQIAG
jgi:hypothetical protein